MMGTQRIKPIVDEEPEVWIERPVCTKPKLEAIFQLQITQTLEAPELNILRILLKN